MEYRFAQKQNGIYVLSRENIEEIASDILNEYAPENLENPTYLNTRNFLCDYLGLTLKYNYIGTPKKEILGLIVMDDIARIPSCDGMLRPQILEETYGTVLIHSKLNEIKKFPRKRYTEMHEAAHFLLHKKYFERELSIERETPSAYIACRGVEAYSLKPKSTTEWMEWQADALAAALLMPRKAFCTCTRRMIEEIAQDEKRVSPLIPYTGTKHIYEIITRVAQVFGVSFRAAEIRMQQFGLIGQRNFRYDDYHSAVI